MKTRFATLLFVGLAALASAQSNEIVVTATKDPVADTDLTVPVVVTRPGDHTSVADLAEDLPGVVVTEYSPGTRSLGAAGFGDNAFGRLNLLVDGVSLNRPDMAPPRLNVIPLSVVDRVETVFGPGSVAYGDQSVGGVVNLVTREPQRPETTLQALVTPSGTNQESLTWGTPFDHGSVLAAVQQSTQRPSRDRSQSTEWSGWAKTLWKPIEGQSLSLSGSVLDGTYQLPGGLLLSQYNTNPDQAKNPNDESHETTVLGNAQWKASWGPLTVTLPAGGTWRGLDYLNQTNTSYTRSGMTLADLEPRVTGVVDALGGELTLEGALSGRWQQLDLKSYTDRALTALGTEATLERRTGAAWGSLRQNWGDHWLVSAEGRTETSSLQVSSAQASALNQTVATNPVAWNIGGAWLPWPNTKISASVARTYRQPFLDEIAYFQDSTPSYNSFTPGLRPETGLATTTGFETTFGDFKASATGTWLEMEDEIYYDSGTSKNVNGAASRHLTTTAILADHWGSLTLQGQYSYAWAQWTSGTNQGKDLTLIPAHRVEGSLRWTILSGLVASTTGRWVGPYREDGDDDNTKSLVPARTTVDLTLSWSLPLPESWGVWTLRGSAENLTDDRTPSEVVWGGWYPQEGRTFLVGLTGAL